MAADPTSGPRATARQVVCPFLRAAVPGSLGEPLTAVAEVHRCVALDGPRVISAEQQEFVCLRSAHVDCPRYRRAVATSRRPRGARQGPAVPRAIAVSLVILALSAGISFGFVMARGGIDLPASALASGAAVVPSGSPSPAASTGPATPSDAATTATTGPTAQPSMAPTASPAVTEAPPATAQPTPTTAPSEGPTSTSSPTVLPSSSPTASGGPSASRLAVLKRCPGQSGCYLYAIRSGDNLFSIAHWFGVPLDTVYAWNPTVKQTGIHPGMTIKIPTPTR